MEHPLDGVFEKLKRADENIINLNREISIFLNAGRNSIGPDDDDQTFINFAREHIYRSVPVRFSVLAGEVIHHLRTSLNHLAFQLTPPQIRATRATNIEFPITPQDPNRIGAEKREIARYNGKIEGISASARAIIDGLQPYKRVDPVNDPLMIIHDMDRTDKHQELAMVIPVFRLGVRPESQPEVQRQAQLYISGQQSNVTMDADFFAEIAFRHFGQRQNEPVIPALFQLTKYVREVIGLFVCEFN